MMNQQYLAGTLSACVILSLVAKECCLAQDQPFLEVPSQAAQDEARATIAEVYEADYQQAIGDTKKLALSRKLLADARATDDAATRFMLLRIAKEVADEIGNIETAAEVTAELSRRYAVDPMTLTAETLYAASQLVQSPASLHALTAEYKLLIFQALEENRFELIAKLRETAIATADKARRNPYRDSLVALLDHSQAVAEAHAAVETSMTTLAAKPLDPAANLEVGKYYSLVRRKWSTGIPMLALSNDARLSDPATRELKGVESAEDQLALGDAWERAANATNGADRDALLERAAHWRRRALHSLSGLEQTKMEKALRELPFPHEPLDWTFDKKTWQRGDSAKALVNADAGFAFLSGFGGKLAGGGEVARVGQDERGNWLLDCRAAQPRLTAEAISVTIPEWEDRGATFQTYDWKKGDPPIRMIHKSQGFCFLSQVSGNLRGGGTWTHIHLNENDGYWYLNGNTNAPFFSAAAVAVTIPDFAVRNNTYQEYEWSTGRPHEHMLHRNEGICVLTGCGGPYIFGDAKVFTRIDDNGFWTLGGETRRNHIHVRATAIRFAP